MDPSRGDLADALIAVAAGHRKLVDDAPFEAGLRHLVLTALAQSETVLSGKMESCWARLPLLACASAACGPPAAALPLAIAVEIHRLRRESPLL